MVSMTTTTQAAVVDAAEFTVRRTILIAAPVEKVWSAVTEPDHISQWFGRPELVGTGAGAEGTITWPDQPSIPLRVEAMDAPRSVSYRWCNDDASETTPTAMDVQHSTVFTFTLEPISAGTRLTVVEGGFDSTSDPAANMESHRQGWDGELDKLIAFAEGAS